MLVSPATAPGAYRQARPSRARARTRNPIARSTGAQLLVAAQRVRLAQGQRGHGVTIHADLPASAAEVAVGLLRQEQEAEPPADRVGVLAVGVGVARAQVGQKRETGQRGVGLPVGALAEAGLAGRAEDGEVVVFLDQRAVVVPGGGAIPAAVGVLVPRQPIEGALDGLLAGVAGAGALGQGRAVGVEPRAVDLGDVDQGPAARRALDLGELGEAAGDHPRQSDRRQRLERPSRRDGRDPQRRSRRGPRLPPDVALGQVPRGQRYVVAGDHLGCHPRGGWVGQGDRIRGLALQGTLNARPLSERAAPVDARPDVAAEHRAQRERRPRPRRGLGYRARALGVRESASQVALGQGRGVGRPPDHLGRGDILLRDRRRADRRRRLERRRTGRRRGGRLGR